MSAEHTKDEKCTDKLEKTQNHKTKVLVHICIFYILILCELHVYSLIMWLRETKIGNNNDNSRKIIASNNTEKIFMTLGGDRG